MVDIVGIGRSFKASVTILMDLLLNMLACIIQCIWRLCDNYISISKTKGALNLDLDPENCQVTSNQFYSYFRARTNNAMPRSCLRLWHTQIFKESKSFQFARRLLNSFLWSLDGRTGSRIYQLKGPISGNFSNETWAKSIIFPSSDSPRAATTTTKQLTALTKTKKKGILFRDSKQK